MSSAADKIKAKQLAAAERRAEGVPVVAERRDQRVTPVRVTLDLAPELHARFVRWCADTAPVLGRAKLPAVDVMRVLVERVISDDELGAEVVRALRSK